MAAISYDRINSLEKSKSDCKIKVRVTRMWPTVSSESSTMKGYNLILLDDDVIHIINIYCLNYFIVTKFQMFKFLLLYM